MSLSPEIKIAERRLGVLELAKALGNVSLACKQRGAVRPFHHAIWQKYNILLTQSKRTLSGCAAH